MLRFQPISSLEFPEYIEGVINGYAQQIKTYSGEWDDFNAGDYSTITINEQIPAGINTRCHYFNFILF